MPVSLIGVSPLFVFNNAVFLVTGWFMILGNQQLGYYQANSPSSFLAGVAQYAGMCVLGLLWMLADWMRGGPRPLHRGLHLRLLLPVALLDLCDTFFTIFGILNLGSGLFIIVFSFVTVLAALIRRVFLKKKLYWWQWLAIAAITCTIIATGARGHGDSSGNDGDEANDQEPSAKASSQRAVGFLCTIIATTMDAIMYVCAEHALSPSSSKPPAATPTPETVAHPLLDLADTTRLEERSTEKVADPEARALLDTAFELIDELRAEIAVLTKNGGGAGRRLGDALEPVTPAEMTAVVGLVNLPLVLLYVAAYSLAGRWDDFVSEPIEHNGCGGTYRNVAFLWVMQGFMYWAHFFSFFWVTKQGSAVAAGVNKAIQGTTIFTLSHIFFCPGGPSLLMEPHDEEQFLLADPGDGVEKQQVWPVLCTAQNLNAQCFDNFKGLAVVSRVYLPPTAAGAGGCYIRTPSRCNR